MKRHHLSSVQSDEKASFEILRGSIPGRWTNRDRDPSESENGMFKEQRRPV